jgi:hypothetical protein
MSEQPTTRAIYVSLRQAAECLSVSDPDPRVAPGCAACETTKVPVLLENRGS